LECHGRRLEPHRAAARNGGLAAGVEERRTEISTDLALTIGGELSLDELVAALQPRFDEPLRSNSEPFGRGR
jgi:hypothetical protein